MANQKPDNFYEETRKGKVIMGHEKAVDKMDEGEFREGNAFREGGTVTVPRTVEVKFVGELVDHPDHYANNGFETIEVLKAWGLDKCAYLWTAAKYLSRLGKKEVGDHIILRDVEKAIFYLQYKSDLLRDKLGVKRKFGVIKD